MNSKYVALLASEKKESVVLLNKAKTQTTLFIPMWDFTKNGSMNQQVLFQNSFNFYRIKAEITFQASSLLHVFNSNHYFSTLC